MLHCWQLCCVFHRWWLGWPGVSSLNICCSECSSPLLVVLAGSVVVDGCVECFSLLMAVLSVLHCWWLCWVFFPADGCVECSSLLMVVFSVLHCWWLCWVFFTVGGCAGCFRTRWRWCWRPRQHHGSDLDGDQPVKDLFYGAGLSFRISYK